MTGYVRVGEAAKMLGRTRAAVYWYIEQGKLKSHVSEQGKTVVSRGDILHLIEKREMAAIPEVAARPNPWGTNWPSEEDIDKAYLPPLWKVILKRRLTRDAAAMALGITATKLGSVLRGQSGISDELAVTIEAVFGLPFEQTKRFHMEWVAHCGKRRVQRSRDGSHRRGARGRRA